MQKIPLSGTKGEGQYALVDDEDFIAASAYAWNLHNGYAVTGISGSKKILPLHRLIIGNPPTGLFVDHIDGNGLNNQQANLRLVTAAQNSYNVSSHRDSTSQFKGVHWDARERLWRASISIGKIRKSLGSFMSELSAAQSYNEAAVQYYGEYARLNIIPADDTETICYRQAIPFHNYTSKYRGVSLLPGKHRWRTKIKIAGKAIHLGYFDSEDEAARAYDTAAKLHHGTRAFLNFPD